MITVRKLFLKMGCKVTFANFIKYNNDVTGAVVRAIKL